MIKLISHEYPSENSASYDTTYARRDREEKRESNTKNSNRNKKIAIFGGAAVATAALLTVAHNQETAVDTARVISNSGPVQEVKASENILTVDVEPGETIGSITEDKVKVVAKDGIEPYIAFNAATDYIEGMPENEKVLRDGVLGDNEKLKVPKKMTVSIEYVNGESISEAASSDIQ